MIDLKPRYQHDCPRCRYLGSLTMPDLAGDWYWCQVGALGPTILMRTGDAGHDYASMPVRVLEQVEVVHDASGEPVFDAWTFQAKAFARMLKEAGMI